MRESRAKREWEGGLEVIKMVFFFLLLFFFVGLGKRRSFGDLFLFPFFHVWNACLWSFFHKSYRHGH